jgi:molybdopterin-guanine dinucleotide biosynthesis protein A
MLDWRGRALRDHVVGRMAQISDDVVVLVAHDDATAERPDSPGGVRYVGDGQEWPGPLVAVAAALDDVTHDIALIVAADMPVVPIRILELLVGYLDAPDEPVTPAPVAGLELSRAIQQIPIAVRRDRVMAALRESIGAGERRLGVLARLPDALAIPEPAWRALDPNGDSLRDIDTQEDLAALLGAPSDE